MLETFNLIQHVKFSMHNLGYTLDRLIFHATSPFISEVNQSLAGISDHTAVLCSLCVSVCSRPPCITKVSVKIKSSEDRSSYRPISNLNFVSKIIERIIYSCL